MRHAPPRIHPQSASLAEIGETLVGRLDDVVAQVQTAIRREVDLYHGDALVSPADMTETIRSHVALVFATLGKGEGYDVGPAYRTGARRAAAGIPFGVVEHSYRVAAAEIWRVIVDEAERLEGVISTQDVMAAASEVWLMHEQFAAAASDGHRDEVTAQVNEREVERSAVIDALLEARIVDQVTIWEAADILGVPRRGPYVVAAVENGRSLRRQDYDRRLFERGFSSAWRFDPGVAVGIVALDDDRQLDMLVRLLSRPDGRRTGISPIYAELGGTALAVRWARTAMVASRGAANPVVLFDQAPLAVASVASPEIMQILSVQVLGRVLELRPPDRDILLDTLETWMRHDASAATTAELLFCHANTVRQRLRRIETLTCRSLHDPVQLAELCLAIETERRLGVTAS